MSNVVWPRNRRGLGASVTSDVRFTHVSGRGVRVIALRHALPTGEVRPQAGATIAAMADNVADTMPNAQDKGLIGVRDWSPPA